MALVFCMIGACLVLGMQLPLGVYVPFGLAGLAAAMVISTPVFLASTAVNLPAAYIRSQEYELVCATALSDRELVRGLVLAALYRARLAVIAAVVLTPVVAYFLPLPWPVQHTLFFINTMPAQSVAAYLVFTAMLEVAWLGLYWLIVATGVSLFLWWRMTTPSLVATLALTAGAWWAAAVLFQSISQSRGWMYFTVWNLAWTGALALVPWALAPGAMGLGARWARRAPAVAEQAW
jgi:hypothetical protein